MTDFSNILKLEEKLKTMPPKYNFNRYLDMNYIEDVEKAYGINLPESYKQFLNKFNGGMILEEEESFYIDMLDWEPDGPKWSSFYLFTLDELIDEYRDLNLDNWLTDEAVDGIYPIIPICRTPKQELLFVISQKGLTKESPVFASYNESGKYSCTKIATDFNCFLGFYLNSEGFPALLPADEEISFDDFVEKNKVFEIAKTRETNLEVINRINYHLKLFPNNAWDYLERGNAYMYDGQRENALEDINKAIEINPEEAYFIYSRGDLILKYGSSRRALIDLDIAVKMKPNDNVYLSTRAKAFYKLENYEKALSDCNKVLEEDNNNFSALNTRIQVYRKLGEHEKADADALLLDDIYLK